MSSPDEESEGRTRALLRQDTEVTPQTIAHFEDLLSRPEVRPPQVPFSWELLVLAIMSRVTRGFANGGGGGCNIVATLCRV